MAFQFSSSARDASLNAIETAIGTSAVLKIYDLSGGAPANCAASITGSVLATMNLPSDWMANASSGSKGKSGTWEDLSADAAGTADFFRVFASDGTTCHIQGTVTGTGGGGDMTLDNTNIAAAQAVSITSFNINAGGA